MKQKQLIDKIKDIDGVKIINADYKADNKTRIAILIPHTYPNYTSDFFLSMIGVLSYSYHWNHQHEDNYAFDFITPPRNFAGIDKIRNGLTQLALQSGADYLMWMDSDQVYPPDTIVKMINDFKSDDTIEAVGGLITFKKPPYLPHIYVKKHATKNTYHLARNYVLNQLMIVEGVGFGCVMIKAEVFKRVKSPWFEFKTDNLGKMVAGEDLGFCIKAKMKAVIDPTIVIGHQELVTYDINDFIQFNQLEVKTEKDGIIHINPTQEKSNEIYDLHIKS